MENENYILSLQKEKRQKLKGDSKMEKKTPREKDILEQVKEILGRK